MAVQFVTIPGVDRPLGLTYSLHALEELAHHRITHEQLVCTLTDWDIRYPGGDGATRYLRRFVDGLICAVAVPAGDTLVVITTFPMDDGAWLRRCA